MSHISMSSEVQFVCKRTNELSENEIKQIIDLYNRVFSKTRNTEEFKSVYFNTEKGYSYHALGVVDNCVIAHNAFIPLSFTCYDHPLCLVISVDAMVDASYRGRGIYVSLLKLCEEAASADGCEFRIGFPNDNSYPIQMKKLHYREIGKLDIFCLPIKVGAIMKTFLWLNPFSAIIASIIMRFSSIRKTNGEIYNYAITKYRPDFDVYRYKWYGGNYKIIKKYDFKFVYTRSVYKNIEAAFLIDVYPLSISNFDTACRYIYGAEKRVPLIIYVGKLPFKPKTMFKVPSCLEPKKFHVVGKPLNVEYDSEIMFNIDNWELNLSVIDLV